MTINFERLDEITSVSQNLAKRYKSSQEYEDLVQEAILVALEHPEDCLWDLVPKMRNAMSAYVTGVKSPVTIPYSGSTRTLLSAIMKDTVGDTQTYTESALLAALHGVREPVEANTLRSAVVDTEEEILTRTLECLRLYLTKEESYTLRENYLENRPLADIALDLGIHENTATARRDSGLKKLRKILMENDDE